MADETIITKSTSELIKARMNGEELEPFVRKARELQYYDYGVEHGMDPDIYGTGREHMDQFELYLNMYPEIREQIKRDAMKNDWQVQYKGDSRNHGNPLAYREAYERAYDKWYKENYEALSDARGEAELQQRLDNTAKLRGEDKSSYRVAYDS